jgi:hypothetical protein
LAALWSWGQTTSAALSGTVTDPAGATVPAAKVTLFGSDTGFMRPFITADNGQFVFPLLPPGRYQLRVEHSGFKLYVRSDIVLSLGQATRINPSLEISSEPQFVEVADRLIDAGTSLGYSVRDNSLQDLPMLGRNFLNLAAIAPGVTGLGSLSEFDNFAPEKDFDLNANGRNSSGNVFLLDGLNVTSNIVLGVANLSPNPDSIAEFTVQTNTFTVEQGRASSLQISMVSRGGTNDWHGTGSYFFTDQYLRARTVFTDHYDPFKKHTVAATLGGPIRRNRTFFFASVEALRSSETQANSIQTFESPEFVAWAKARFPNSVGTRVLTDASLQNVSTRGVIKRASDVIGSDCGTPAGAMLPCDMPLIVEGQYTQNATRNGLQYSFRGDRSFRDSRDRIFGNYYRTTLDLGNPVVRAGTSNASTYGSRAVVLSWAHTFSSSLLSDVSFSGIKVQGDNAPTARYHIPEVDIGGQSTNISPGWGGAYAQHNYNWRAVLSWVRGSHTLKFGGNYHWSDDFADFTRTTARPIFYFTNLLDLVRDQPQTESSVGYDPLTGQPGPSVFGGKIVVGGVFVQDEWNATPNLTVTMGLRWDDFGNPMGTEGMRFSTLDPGSGSTLDERIANAVLKTSNRAYVHRLNRNFAPRAGFAWAPGGSGRWRIRGGAGLYQDWTALGQSVDLIRWNPPNSIFPTFRADSGIKPIFSLGTSDTYPFGFVLPQIPSIQFDEHGGLKDTRPDIGFLSSDLVSPQTFNYLVGVERELPLSMRLGLNFSGSYTWHALVGTDVNRKAGDLLDGTLDRLNPSFGSMHQVWNRNVIRYDALIATLQRNLRWGTSFQMSYTFSKTTDLVQAGTRQTWDDFYSIPDQHSIEQYKAYANWDARRRFSVTGVWRIPGWSRQGLLRSITKGWNLSTVVIAQSGTPFTVVNRNPFHPILDASGKVIGLAADSGDYNADGYNYDYPNTPAIDYTGSHSRQEYINGLFTQADFPVPEAGTEGNLKRNGYRNPGLFTIDAAVLKNSPVRMFGERVNVQLRIEAFNALNRTNLQGVDNNLASATFGRSTAAYSPRVIQLGLRLAF